MGISRGEYLEIFERRNCLTFYPGKSGRQKGDKFPMRKAREAADVHRQHFRDRTVIFVGRNVAVAFGFSKSTMDFFEWRRCKEWGFRATVIPHTSGCNHYWNSSENKELARKFFQDEIILPTRGLLLSSPEA